MTNRVRAVECKKFDNGQLSIRPDLVVVEEPMEVRIGFGSAEHRQQKAIAVTMRTPGHDLELAAGFLFTEGIISSNSDLLSIKHCIDSGKNAEEKNVIRAEIRPEVVVSLKQVDRNFYTTSACGVCGKSTIEAIETGCQPVVKTFLLDKAIVEQLPEKLRSAQAVFEHTGGLHAAGLFNNAGDLLLLREDVGRHNATDKVIGAALMKGQVPLTDHLLMLSGRISFELVQKAAMAGIPIVAAVGAPSTLAIDLAAKMNIVLCGFIREGRFTVYTGQDQVV